MNYPKTTTTVMQVITEEKATFYNSMSLEDNLLTAIITFFEDERKRAEWEYRAKIKAEANIQIIHSKNGQQKAYSDKYDCIAYKSEFK